MNSILTSIILASITTLFALQMLRPFAIKVGLIDKPSKRKPHLGSVPLIGGLGMFLGVLVGLLITSHDFEAFLFYLLSSIIIITTGVFDDYRNISVSIRFIIQVIVAIIIVFFGEISIYSLGFIFGDSEITLSNWNYFFSIIAIVTAMNAVNMADGIHGLAGGNSLITFLAVIYLSAGATFQHSILISFLLCSVIPIFLIQNLCLGISNEKRIFMGDAGSMFLGLTIAWILIDLSQGEQKIFEPVTALWLFSLPLIEITLAIFRRMTSGSSPFKPDLLHSHHLLMRLGLNDKSTLAVLLFVSMIMAIIGILGERYQVDEKIMFFGFIFFFAAYFFLHWLFFRKIQMNN